MVAGKPLNYTCPVCGWPEMEEPAYDEFGSSSFEICRCCGTQFGYQDARRTHAELRAEWISGGMRWSSKAAQQPAGWDPVAQLRAAGF